MSGLWTPGGEHTVPRPEPESPPRSSASAATERVVAEERAGGDERASDELAALQRELLAAPVEEVVANHCYGLFQLAALHLGQQPPNLEAARLAIDAFRAIVDTLDERLGAAKTT